MKDSIADIFRDEFHWMQREMKGLYPWLDKNRWEFIERLTGGLCDHPFCHRHRGNGRNLISSLVSSQLQPNRSLLLWLGAVMSILASGYAFLTAIFYAWLNASGSWGAERAALWTYSALALSFISLCAFAFSVVWLWRHYREPAEICGNKH